MFEWSADFEISAYSPGSCGALLYACLEWMFEWSADFEIPAYSPGSCGALLCVLYVWSGCLSGPLILRYQPQGFIQDFKLGGRNPCFVEARQTREVWGHAPPENFDFYIL